MSARPKSRPAPAAVERIDDLDESELEPVDEPASAAPVAPQTAIPSGPLVDDCAPEDDTSPVQLAPPEETERLPRFASGFSTGIVAGLMVVSFALGAIALLIVLQVTGRIRPPSRGAVIDARTPALRPMTPSLTVTPLPSPPVAAEPPPTEVAPPPQAAAPSRPSPSTPRGKTAPVARKTAPPRAAAPATPPRRTAAAPTARKTAPTPEKAARRSSSTRSESSKINWIDPFSK